MNRNIQRLIKYQLRIFQQFQECTEIRKINEGRYKSSKLCMYCWCVWNEAQSTYRKCCAKFKDFSSINKGSSNSFQGHNPSNKANKGRCKPSTKLWKIDKLIKNLQRNPPTVFKDTTIVFNYCCVHENCWRIVVSLKTVGGSLHEFCIALY